MTFNVLTTVLTTIVGALGKAQSSIGKAGAIMTGLAVIEIVLAALWVAMDGGSMSEGFKKLLQLSFWVWFATHFAGFAKYFSDSLVQMALGAGGQPGNYGLLLDPSRIAGMGLDVTQPLVQSMHDAGITHLGDVLLDAICWVILVASFFLIACQICVAVIEYYLVVTLASCLIPFGISQHTRFLAEKAIGAAVAVSVKLMVLSFILALIQPVLGQFHLTPGTDELPLNQLLAMCLVCVVVAILVWRAPGFASDLLAASPSLSAAHVGQHITGAIGTGAAAYTGAATGGAVAVNYLRTKLGKSGEGGGGKAAGLSPATAGAGFKASSAARPSRQVARGGDNGISASPNLEARGPSKPAYSSSSNRERV